MRTSATRWPRVSVLSGAGVGFAGGIVATIVAAVGGLVDALSAPVLMVAIVSTMTTLPGALVAGMLSWLLYASFILGHAGQLATNSDSFHAAAVLAGTAVVGTAMGAAIRWIQRPALAWIPRPRAQQDHVRTSVGGGAVGG